MTKLDNKQNKTSTTITVITIFILSLTLFRKSTMLGQEYSVIILSYGITYFFSRLSCLILLFLNYSNVYNLLKSLSIIILAEIILYQSKSFRSFELLYILSVGMVFDEKMLTKTILISNIILVVFTLVFFFCGIIDQSVGIKDDVFVQSYGFATSNTLGIILFQISICLWILRCNKLFCFIFFSLNTFVCYYVLYSRTAFIALSILSCAAFVNLIPILNNIAIKVFNYANKLKVPYIILFATVLLSIGMGYGFFGSDELNTLLSGRVNASRNYVNHYSITLFGQQLLRNDVAYQDTLTTLDNSYLNLLLNYGVVLFVLLVLCFSLLIRHSILTKKSRLLFAFMLYIVYGFSEIVSYFYLYNFILLFIANVIWNQNVIKEQKESKNDQLDLSEDNLQNNLPPLAADI